MLFDLPAVVSAVKVSLNNVDKKRSNDINIAIGLALDDMSMRLRSKAFLTSYDVTITAALREKELRGDNDDLRSLFALVMGSGANYRVLEHENEQQFLRDHNDPQATAGRPTRFTQLVSSEGFPTVRFNLPLSESENLKVYYYLELSPENISASRSISAITSGALAYFHGVDSASGQAYYNRYRELSALARASDSFTPEVIKPFHISREDKKIKSIQHQLAQRRR